VDPEGRPSDYLGIATASIDRAKDLLVKRDYGRSYFESRRSLAMLARSQRGLWERVTEQWPQPVASPAAVSLATLPEHVQLAGTIVSRGAGPSLLAGGEFEGLRAMLNAGWRHSQHPTPGVKSDVELSAVDPHGGSLCLKMRAWAEDPTTSPGQVETPPVWVTSGDVPVERGQIIRIHGWVRVPQPIRGGVDGVMIIDSLTGPALAARINEAGNWREFTLYRAVPETGPMTVTFALAGMGEAWFDGVTIAPLDRPAPARAAVPQASRLRGMFGQPRY
jgi:hypothetical protein